MTDQDFAYRQVLYYVMVVGAGKKMLRDGLPLGEKECAKLGMLAALRCLSDFLSGKGNPAKGDVTIRIFQKWGIKKYKPLPEWDRISKIVAHPQRKKVKVFRDSKCKTLGESLLQSAANFIRECDQKKAAKARGRANEYRDEIRRLRPDLKL